MQGSKSSYFAKSNKRNRHEDDSYGGGSNSKRHVDGNKLARQKANLQRNKDEQEQS